MPEKTTRRAQSAAAVFIGRKGLSRAVEDAHTHRDSHAHKHALTHTHTHTVTHAHIHTHAHTRTHTHAPKVTFKPLGYPSPTHDPDWTQGSKELSTTSSTGNVKTIAAKVQLVPGQPLTLTGECCFRPAVIYLHTDGHRDADTHTHTHTHTRTHTLTLSHPHIHTPAHTHTHAHTHAHKRARTHTNPGVMLTSSPSMIRHSRYAVTTGA